VIDNLYIFGKRTCLTIYKKSVKISKGQPESVNRRRENKWQMKIDKKTNNDLQNITHETKDRVNINPTKNMRVNSCGSKG
jgi:hypothetical protein